MLVYDATYSAYDGGDIDAIEYARGMVWCELEATEQDIKYKRFVEEVDGVEVWYDFGADYYFFVERVVDTDDE